MTIEPYTEPRFAPLPPARGTTGKGRINWHQITTKLHTRPGEWAAIGTLPADQAMGNRGVRLARQGVKTTIRSNGDGTATIWACYVGILPAACTVPPLEVPAAAMAAWFGSEAA